MAEFSNDGKVSLWGNDSENPNAPRYKGKAYAHRDLKKGEEVSVSLWENESENPKAPVLRGNLQDPRPRQSAQHDMSQYQMDTTPAAVPASSGPDPDDQIPF